MPDSRRRLPARAALAGLLLLAGTAAAVGGLGTATAESPAPLAATLAGDCDHAGSAPMPLSPLATGDPAGGAGTIPVLSSTTTVDGSLPSLLAARHAIRVTASAAGSAPVVACGLLGGLGGSDSKPSETDTRLVGLTERNDSGYHGIASLTGKGAKTEITLYLAKDPAAEATPAATPSASATKTVAVAIKGFVYNPNPIEVAVGTTVTWTNDDPTPHTVTGVGPAKAVIKSPPMQQGAVFSVTFDKAGEYAYYCEYHPGMKGKVVVK